MHGRPASAIGIAAAAAALLISLGAARTVDGQDWRDRDRLSRIEPGTYITVRTTQSISSSRRDGRIYDGVVEEDVWDDYRRLAVPAIPRGSRVELIVRTARDGDLILDLESIFAHGQRYAVDAVPQRVEHDRHRDGGDTAEFVGGGALLGTVIGAIANGGKGAAIGAAAGAAAGLGLAVRGRNVDVPAGSLVTFQLQHELPIGVRDSGYSRQGGHYHRDGR
jgi:hypothetical protein